MEKNLIKNSLKLLHLEKFLIIKKEIGFIENILKYYKGYKDNRINPAKHNIDKLINDIDSLKYRIKNLEAISRKRKRTILEEDSNVNFILFYDYTKIQIEEMLLVIEALYTKMNQLFGEMLNQYLPYPTFFGRRYSSIGLMMYLDNYYQKVLKSLIVSNESNNEYKDQLVLGWSYNSGFKHKMLRNRDIQRVNYNYKTHNNYIELPYWYYELPFLIPAITHEVVSIAIREKNSKIRPAYKNFKHHIKKFFNDKSNKLVRRVSEILGYNWVVRELSKELFADIVSYKIHGFSYILTVFHNLLGENIAKDFLEIEYSRDGTKVHRYNIKANDWIFSAKREHNLLRLHLLLTLFKEFEENTSEYKEAIEQMEELLNTVMVLDSQKEPNKDSFEYYYLTSNPGNKSTYNAVKNYMQQLYTHIKNYSLYHEIDLILCDVPEIVTKDIKEPNSDKIGVDFIDLWKERFDVIKKDDTKVPYKGMFRFKIHKYISQISYLQDKQEPIIKVLTLRKARKDLVNKIFKNEESLENIAKQIDEFNSNCDKNLEQAKNIILQAKSLTINEHLDSFSHSKTVDLHIEHIKSIDENNLKKEDIEKGLENEILSIVRSNHQRGIVDIFKDKDKKEQEEFVKEYKLIYLIKNYKKLSSMFLENMKYNIDKNRKRLKAWMAYGIYDFAYLESKTNRVKLYENSYTDLICDLYYFDSKYILMEVAQPIVGDAQNSGFSLIMNIELKKIELKEDEQLNKAAMSGYNNLNGAISSIQKELEKFKAELKMAQIYKSLGPKDLTVIVEDTSLSTLYEIIKNINSIDEINRTFTIFCSLNSPSGKSIDDDFELNSYIRVPKGSKLFEDTNSKARALFEEIAKNENNEVFYTTGIMDIAIKWKKTKTIQELFNNYEKLIPYMTDYQTKIEKRFVVGRDKDKGGKF